MIENRLSRQLNLGALILYGVGDILGAGIYALVGKVVGIAGQSAWISFLVSATLASVTGLTYAELSARIPKSGGAAAFCTHIFKHPIIPFLVGILILASGVTSAATVSIAFYGYLKVFLDIPQLIGSLGLILFISFISFWGIRETAYTNNLLTVAELFGLLLVIVTGTFYAADLNSESLVEKIVPTMEIKSIISGATLAFYAFVGFEDLANLSEEAKNPSRDIPRAILCAVTLSTILYLSVVFVVLLVLTPQEASQSITPLLDVLTKSGFPLPSWGFACVALLAVCNTGLANLVMSSRLLYGMADDGLLPKGLTQVHPHRHTPWVAVIVSMILCIVLVVTGGVSIMAQTTSLLLVLVFLILHISLITIKKREPASSELFQVPKFIPYIGICFCILLMTRFPAQVYLRTLLISGIGIIAFLALRVQKATVSENK